MNNLKIAIEEGISALAGAIAVCGDIGNLSHAKELLELELEKMK